MLTKSTHVYTHHGLPLECDVYTQDAASDTHVFLYFHPGGLTDWGREFIAPWFVQACLQRKWTLISASYRLMPQVGTQGLIDDVSAAYKFARSWAVKDGKERPVLLGGASAGFFNSALIINNCSPPPIALLGICGLHTFRHPFYNSSTLLLPEPIEDVDVAEFISRPIEVGKQEVGSIASFALEKLLPDGSKNPDYKPPKAPVIQDPPKHPRGHLYEYYIYKNLWLDLVGDIDAGYTWAKDPSNKRRVESWPPTVLIHGDADLHVPLDIAEQMRECLGEDKVRLFVANGMHHLFETFYFLEGDGPGMDAVRDALKCFDGIVAAASK
ncbi:hypothetical protein CDV36_007457 [Fusarium kuroshium]|uniref:Alpha/beta hydrolase fold-3 domain-containing protein n=1 Tax=Fusarium kuroshium TaxID=2010991 RepID=A0A3M2S5T6_9HYPO|nr:hypothetical protein CDV36_007457 [Fusarium kuroshium]